MHTELFGVHLRFKLGGRWRCTVEEIEMVRETEMVRENETEMVREMKGDRYI
jgi:hypothetical protein